MTIQVTVEKGAQAFVMKVVGQTDAEELSAAYATVFEQPHYHPQMDAMWDICEMRLSQIEISEVRKFAKLLRTYANERGTNYKVAIATQHQVDYQLLRVYITFFKLVGTFQMRVFNDLAKAKAWLQAKA